MSSAKCSCLILLMVCSTGPWSSAAFAGPSQQQEKPASAVFKAMDANGDGKVSPEEHAQGARKMFEAMDANRDGSVTAEEMGAAHDKITGKRAAKAEMSPAEKIKVVDANGDGLLTGEEHAAGSKKMFDMMDSDKDGYLTESEVEAGHAKMMKKRPD